MLLNCGVFRKPGAPRRTVFPAQGPNVGGKGSEQPCGGVDIPARGSLGGERAGAGGGASLVFPRHFGKGLRPSWNAHIGSVGCYPALNAMSPKL